MDPSVFDYFDLQWSVGIDAQGDVAMPGIDSDPLQLCPNPLPHSAAVPIPAPSSTGHPTVSSVTALPDPNVLQPTWNCAQQLPDSCTYGSNTSSFSSTSFTTQTPSPSGFALSPTTQQPGATTDDLDMLQADSNFALFPAQQPSATTADLDAPGLDFIPPLVSSPNASVTLDYESKLLAETAPELHQTDLDSNALFAPITSSCYSLEYDIRVDSGTYVAVLRPHSSPWIKYKAQFHQHDTPFAPCPLPDAKVTAFLNTKFVALRQNSMDNGRDNLRKQLIGQIRARHSELIGFEIVCIRTRKRAEHWQLSFICGLCKKSAASRTAPASASSIATKAIVVEDVQARILDKVAWSRVLHGFILDEYFGDPRLQLHHYCTSASHTIPMEASSEHAQVLADQEEEIVQGVEKELLAGGYAPTSLSPAAQPRLNNWKEHWFFATIRQVVRLVLTIDPAQRQFVPPSRHGRFYLSERHVATRVFKLYRVGSDPHARAFMQMWAQDDDITVGRLADFFFPMIEYPLSIAQLVRAFLLLKIPIMYDLEHDPEAARKAETEIRNAIIMARDPASFAGLGRWLGMCDRPTVVCMRQLSFEALLRQPGPHIVIGPTPIEDSVEGLSEFAAAVPTGAKVVCERVTFCSVVHTLIDRSQLREDLKIAEQQAATISDRLETHDRLYECHKTKYARVDKKSSSLVFPSEVLGPAFSNLKMA